MKKLILNILTTTIATTSIALSMQFDDIQMDEGFKVHSSDGITHFEIYKNHFSQLNVVKDSQLPDNYMMPENVLLTMIQDIAKENIDRDNIRTLFLPEELNHFAVEGRYVSAYLRTIHQAFPNLQTFNIGILTSQFQDLYKIVAKLNSLHFSIDRLPPKVKQKKAHNRA